LLREKLSQHSFLVHYLPFAAGKSGGNCGDRSGIALLAITKQNCEQPDLSLHIMGPAAAPLAAPLATVVIIPTEQLL
jgi:hypothetical protein